MAVLVDSNVLLDVITDDQAWSEWSTTALERVVSSSIAVINPIVYAEVSVGFDRIEDLEDALPPDLFRREALPFEAGFLAGKAFVRYRRAGGTRTSMLPDFLIGAHAAVDGHQVLTRDPVRYRAYFPSVVLIAPDR